MNNCSSVNSDSETPLSQEGKNVASFSERVLCENYQGQAMIAKNSFLIKSYSDLSKNMLAKLEYNSALFFSGKTQAIINSLSEDQQLFYANEIIEHYIQRGKIYKEFSDLDKGLNSYNQALILFEKQVATDSLSFGRLLNYKGEVYINQGKFQLAKYYCLEANKILLKSKTHEENLFFLAENLMNIGKINMNFCNYDEALSFFQKSIDIYFTANADTNQNTAANYLYIGMIYEKLGDYKTALEYEQKALSIYEQMPIINDRLIADCYHQLGIIYGKCGYFRKSLELNNKCLKVSINAYGENSREVGSSLNNIAICYHHLGEYFRSNDYLIKALYVNNNLPYKNHLNIGCNYNNLGTNYDKLGLHDEAINSFNLALKHYLQIFDDNYEEVCRTYINLARQYALKGQTAKAEEYLNKALHTLQDIYNTNNNPLVANIYTKLANVSILENKPEKAKSLLYKSIAIRSYCYENHHSNIADDYNTLGQLYLEQDSLVLAEECFRKALDANSGTDQHFLSKKSINPSVISNSTRVNTISGLARLYLEKYDNKPQIVAYLDSSLKMYDNIFLEIDAVRYDFNYENSRILLSEKTHKIYEEAVKTAFTKARISNNYNKVFEYIERGKCASLNARLSELETNALIGIPDSLIEKEIKLKQTLSNLSVEIAKENNLSDAEYEPGFHELENKYFEVAKSYDLYIADIENKYPQYKRSKLVPLVYPSKVIQKNLDSNQVMLDYFLVDTILYVAIVSKNNTIVRAKVLSSEFKNTVNTFSNSIRKVDEDAFIRSGQMLYKTLIFPFEDYLTKAEKLIIIPDEDLFHIPFECLFDKIYSEGNTLDYSKIPYLIKTHTIVYHFSANSWYRNQKEYINFPGYHSDFVGFAPIFNNNTENEIILSSNIPSYEFFPDSLTYRSTNLNKVCFDYLPYSQKEVVSIYKLFNKNERPAGIYLFNEADEANFKKSLLSSKYTHVATHGFVNNNMPDMTFLAFSQSTASKGLSLTSSNSEDNFLFAKEIYSLSLTSELVVLSSCESGLGKMMKGEGMMSMARAFSFAGAKNIVFSLFKVPDKHTKDLMVNFYTHILDDKDYADALRKAKLNLIADNMNSLPLFWAGFIIIGK